MQNSLFLMWVGPIHLHRKKVVIHALWLTLFHSPISTQKNNLIFWIMKQPKRSQWLIGGSFTDSLRPSQTNKQTQKWWETETPCPVPYSQCWEKPLCPLFPLFCATVWKSEWIIEIIYSFGDGEREVIPSSQTCKGKKNAASDDSKGRQVAAIWM